MAGPWVTVSFDQWAKAEKPILRGIARRSQAAMQEAGDPAMASNTVELIALLAEWQAWRDYGLTRSWQAP